MERQNILTGIKLLSNGPASPKYTNKQSAKDREQLLSIKENNLIIKNKHNYKLFKFDCCLGNFENQHQIYDNFCLTTAEDFVDGYNSTLILCGNIDSGNGFNDVLLGKNTQETKGIIPRFIDHMANSIKYFSTRKFMFKVSFVEINNEQIIDLLGTRKCKLQIKRQKDHKNSFYVNNLEIKTLQKIDQIQSFYLVANRKRQYAYSKQYRKRQNSTSFFTIYLESLSEKNNQYRRSHYVFCELSSNSFQKFKHSPNEIIFGRSINSNMIKSIQGQKNNIQRQKEFNLSNYSFQNVVNTIVYGQQSANVPFNDSKVTKLLSQALGGDMKTAILGLIETQNSAQLQNTFQMLKTLQVASQIENTPTNLKDQSSNYAGYGITECLQQIHKLSNEIEELKLELQILINNSQYVQNEVQKLKRQNDPLITKDNEFCSEQHIGDRFLQEKTKKQWQLKKQIKSLEKNIKDKISSIQNLHNIQDQQNIDQNQKNPLNREQINREQIISKRKQILLRVKAIKQKRLNQIPSSQTEKMQRQKKRQAFALQIQFQKQRNLFTDQIRAMEEKMSFYKQIAQSCLNKQEIQIIKANCKFDQTKRTFQLPMFMVRERKVKESYGKEGFSSQRKFIVSPRSKSFNSYHSNSSVRKGNKTISFQKKMQNILARKPKPNDEYNLEARDNKAIISVNSPYKMAFNLKNNPQVKMSLARSKQIRSPITSNRTNLNLERNQKKKMSEYKKNVRSEYELGSVDMQRVLKYNKERSQQKHQERQYLKDRNNLSPFMLIKRQQLDTQPVKINDSEHNRHILSHNRQPLRDKIIKEPLIKSKK